LAGHAQAVAGANQSVTFTFGVFYRFVRGLGLTIEVERFGETALLTGKFAVTEESVRKRVVSNE